WSRSDSPEHRRFRESSRSAGPGQSGTGFQGWESSCRGFWPAVQRSRGEPCLDRSPHVSMTHFCNPSAPYPLLQHTLCSQQVREVNFFFSVETTVCLRRESRGSAGQTKTGRLVSRRNERESSAIQTR